MTLPYAWASIRYPRLDRHVDRYAQYGMLSTLAPASKHCARSTSHAKPVNAVTCADGRISALGGGEGDLHIGPYQLWGGRV